MRRRCHIAILAVVASLSLACGGNTPTAPSAPATPSPAPVVSPSPSSATAVRLSIAAYSGSGALIVSWPVGALVTLEAVPVCTQAAPSSVKFAIVGLDPARLVAQPATRADVRRLSDTCRLPAWVDWELSGAACNKRGDTNGSALTVQCTLVGELRAEAVSREVRSGPEVARGTGQFRVTP